MRPSMLNTTDWDNYSSPHMNGLSVYATEKDFEAAHLRADLDALMSDNKLTNMAMLGLQAIAAFAALGIFIVQVRALSKRTRKGKKRSR